MEVPACPNPFSRRMGKWSKKKRTYGWRRIAGVWGKVFHGVDIQLTFNLRFLKYLASRVYQQKSWDFCQNKSSMAETWGAPAAWTLFFCTKRQGTPSLERVLHAALLVAPICTRRCKQKPMVEANWKGVNLPKPKRVDRYMVWQKEKGMEESIAK